MSGTVFQFDWEIRLMEWLQSIVAANPFMIYIIKAITQFGEPVFSALIIAYIYWNHDKRKGMRIAVDVLGTMIVNNQIKNIFDRMRPYMTNETIECLYPVDPDYPLDDIFRQGYSFPSGHTANVTSIFVSLFLQDGKKILLSLGSILVFLICFARVAVGVHYPTDVLAAVIVGIVTPIVAELLQDKYEPKILYPVIILYTLAGVLFCMTDDYLSCTGIIIGFLLADLYDERHGSFKITSNRLRGLIRTLFGGIIFLSISYLMKYPFEHLSADLPQLFFRFLRLLRYGTATFITMGVYPRLFRYNIFRFNEKEDQ